MGSFLYCVFKRGYAFCVTSFLCLQSTSANADKVCRHGCFEIKFADMQTLCCIFCIFTWVDFIFCYAC